MKSQVSSLFTYITAAVVLGVILIFGTYGVIQLINTTSEIEARTFQNDFNRAISQLTTQYGAVRFVDLPRMQGYRMICAVDYTKIEYVHSIFDSTDMSDYFLIKGDLEDKTANIFLIQDNVAERFLNENVRVPDISEGYECQVIPSSGLVRMRVEGFGRYAEITFID